MAHGPKRWLEIDEHVAALSHAPPHSRQPNWPRRNFSRSRRVRRKRRRPALRTWWTTPIRTEDSDEKIFYQTSGDRAGALPARTFGSALRVRTDPERNAPG